MWTQRLRVQAVILRPDNLSPQNWVGKGQLHENKRGSGFPAERTVCPLAEAVVARLFLESWSAFFRGPLLFPTGFSITPVTLLLKNLRHYAVDWGGSSTLTGLYPDIEVGSSQK
jgi:hypothetical protein